MLQGWIILSVSFAYLCLLFAIAYYGDKRADAGRSLIANPYFYALSIAVYCTSWTYYGSVGRAAVGGVEFLTIYIGPTLMAALWWFVLRKMLRISKANRITSIADFIASRYGKSPLLGGLVTVIAVVGIMPYISVQLKAVSASFNVLLRYPEVTVVRSLEPVPILYDTALYVALVMAAFSILFGTRHIDATEHHEGMVAAIAFESVVKLVAFLAIGIFVTFLLYGSFGEVFAAAASSPRIAELFQLDPGNYGNWIALTLLSMAAIICLPRQFQIIVVENVNEAHLKKAVWLFPLYLLLINIFVLPIAFAGLLQFPTDAVNPDTYVLALPMSAHLQGLALFAFIGGLSAATGMVIVESIALSTMICNDLVMPLLLRWPWLRLSARRDLTQVLLAIRRGSIGLVLLLGYVYFRLIGESYALVSIGLLSFVAAAQFAPAMIGGMFWKGGSRAGALAGLGAGFAIWLYTLLLPSFARSGWLAADFIDQGPFGIALLRPYQLLGVDLPDPITHAVFWSMVANLGLYIGVSLFSRQSAIERLQATRFVEVFRQPGEGAAAHMWRGSGFTVHGLHALVARFVGVARAEQAFADYARSRGLTLSPDRAADAGLVAFTERLLAGAIGAASARVMLASAASGEGVSIDEVMQILDEASQVIEYSRQLEQKSHELEEASAELRAANQRLKELDRLKDEFLTTVTHELRTPLTSIRAFSEILHDNRDLDAAQRQEFLGIVIKESERLTRLINQVLDLAKIEAGRFDWQIGEVSLADIVHDAVAATGQLFKERDVALAVDMPEALPLVHSDRDQLMQVVINLLSNAVKFCSPAHGRVTISLRPESTGLRASVRDNGPGIAPEHLPMVFEKFRQFGDMLTEKPEGTGLGLAISRRIVEHLGGRMWVESRPGAGSAFHFTLPIEAPLPERVAAE